MKLTGIAFLDFMEWLHENYSNAYDVVRLMKPVLLNAIIIEWFDSVGIYIFIDMTNVSDRFIFHVNNEFNEVEYNSRQQATEDAILKANEIYNQKQE